MNFRQSIEFVIMKKNSEMIYSLQSSSTILQHYNLESVYNHETITCVVSVKESPSCAVGVKESLSCVLWV